MALCCGVLLTISNTFAYPSSCYEGRWDCKSLHSPATCAVEEGSHVTTFDGKAYIFHGDCHYVLAKIERKVKELAHVQLVIEYFR